MSSETRKPVCMATSKSVWSHRPSQVLVSGAVRSVDPVGGEKRDELAVGAFGRDREHPLDERSVFGVA